MTRTDTNAPKHSATRWSSAYGWLSRSPARSIEVIGLLIGLLAGFGAAITWAATRGPAQPAGPVMAIAQPPQAVHVSADAEPNPAVLDGEWEAYSDRSTCADWAGGDGVSAFRVSPSQLAWFFADTFLGPAGPATGYSHGSGFVNNSVVVQTTTGTDSTFVTMTGGDGCGSKAGKPVTSVVGPPSAPGSAKDRYWDADGIDVGGTIVKFYNRYLPGGVPFIPTGTVMATFPVSQLTSAGQPSRSGGLAARPGLIPVPSYVPPAGGTPLIWGAALLRAGDMVYVYGRQAADPSAPDAQLYLARVPATDLTRFSSWRFYAGDGQWAAGQQNAQPVQPQPAALAVSSGFSVIAMGGRYWLIQAGPQSGSADIDAYPAAVPWGPFDPAEGITLGVRYHVYLDGPGEDGRVAATNRDQVMITGLRPGEYSATVVPVNVRDTAGGGATVRFTVP